MQDHVPKVKDFFQKECWAHHPKPHAEYMAQRAAQDAALEAERGKLIPGMCELFTANPYHFLDNVIPISFSGYFVTTDNKVCRLIYLCRLLRRCWI